MARKGRFYDLTPTPQNLRAIWDLLHTLDDGHTANLDTITAQQAAIDALTTDLATVRQQAQHALITAGTPVTSTPGGGGGGGGGGTGGNHDNQYAVVVAVIADLVAHGVNLSGSCGSFAVTNEVVKWLRPSQPDVGIIHKPSGNNCGGYSTDALMYLDGAVFDLLINAENAPPTGAAPQWSYDGQRPASDWRDPT